MDSVVSVERHSKRVLNLKMVLDDALLKILMVYAYHSEKVEEERKEFFWNEVFHLVSCIHQNEMFVLAGDMNWHEVVMLAMMGCKVVLDIVVDKGLRHSILPRRGGMTGQ